MDSDVALCRQAQNIDPELDAFLHNHPEKGARLDHASYWTNSEWTRRENVRRSTLGFKPLNSPFAGCEAHHINKQDVIYIPKAMHRSIYHNQWTGKGMDKINALAGAFLTEDWT